MRDYKTSSHVLILEKGTFTLTAGVILILSLCIQWGECLLSLSLISYPPINAISLDGQNIVHRFWFFVFLIMPCRIFDFFLSFTFGETKRKTLRLRLTIVSIGHFPGNDDGKQKCYLRGLFEKLSAKPNNVETKKYIGLYLPYCYQSWYWRRSGIINPSQSNTQSISLSPCVLSMYKLKHQKSGISSSQHYATEYNIAASWYEMLQENPKYDKPWPSEKQRHQEQNQKQHRRAHW